ncbi:hypothetical protein ACQ4LE_001340 [Meloidogyne hapla]|uniref:Uncharacterized protein n=1 Tax=Meloidogyne hapla TaxID=6305 RepID=A0A1I8BXL6_MELHA
MNNTNNNFTPDKKRKSLFGFSIKLKPFSSSNELLRIKRHNSVNYATFPFSLNRDNEEIETEENRRDEERKITKCFRSDSGNESLLNQEDRQMIETEENRLDNKQSFRSVSGKHKEREARETEEAGTEKQKNNNNTYTQSFRSASGNKNNTHHNHGSVQNLVIRRQRAAATKRSPPQLTQLSRRPSVPSSPLSIVGRLRKSFSTVSLDEEEDSAFCSSESSPACSIISSSVESSPNKNINENTPKAFQWQWTEQQKEKIEAELEQHCIYSFGHKLATNPKLAFTYLSKRQIKPCEMDFNNNVLCAEGNVQFHLLSMIAPSNKRVVNIGSPNISNNDNIHWFHLSPSLRHYSRSNLELSRTIN